MNAHPERAAAFVANRERAQWHDETLWLVRRKRDRAVRDVPEWELLRERAEAIKSHTLSRLAEYMEQFEANAQRLGAAVHWARDAAEHNRIVLALLRERNVTRVVKSKSMLTEECGLNPYLERHGIEVTDTDLGEWIVQLRREPPSHIVLPAIHLRKREIGDLFAKRIGTPPGTSDPEVLTHAARRHLRGCFLEAQAGITGVNFAIAETGGIVVCTNEGNADLGTSLPSLHIACMGIEKMIPRIVDLPVFLRLLARSATGQAITTYTSHFHGPRRGGELHIVLVDNGRSELLASREFGRSLSCIRCGACMNTCPVFRRSGGHSYGTTVPGPIGSILEPARDPARHSTLPHASSLCGSCTDVCPVKIDLHRQLLVWRGVLRERGLLPWWKVGLAKLFSVILRNARLYAFAGALVRLLLRHAPRSVLYRNANAWGRQRELPIPPRESFRQLYRRRKIR
ncbi:MAG TPA: lactate utilization protein B [Candidatus Binatia bacterium]|nr:lactate utilization protein B [Candidatus Binatia bacterium]